MVKGGQGSHEQTLVWIIPGYFKSNAVMHALLPPLVNVIEMEEKRRKEKWILVEKNPVNRE